MGLNREISGNLENRLALHDCKVVGKRVKGLDNQTLGTGLDIDPTDGVYGQPPPSGKSVKKAVGHAIVAEFLLKRPKNIWLNTLQLEGGLVADTVGALQ